MRASFANYDPATSSWRTSQLCLDGEWSEFSETWPRAGMTRNGKAYEHATLVPRTDESESGLWPTPDANTSTYSNHYNGFLNLREAVRMWPTPNVSGGGNPPHILVPYKNHFVRRSGKKAHLSLDQAVKLPTMTARDSRSFKGNVPPPRHMGGISLTQTIGGRLNPTWTEWLMGFPLSWTDCEDSATPSSHKSQNGSAEEYRPTYHSRPMDDYDNEDS